MENVVGVVGLVLAAITAVSSSKMCLLVGLDMCDAAVVMPGGVGGVRWGKLKDAVSYSVVRCETLNLRVARNPQALFIA